MALSQPLPQGQRPRGAWVHRVVPSPSRIRCSCPQGAPAGRPPALGLVHVWGVGQAAPRFWAMGHAPLPLGARLPFPPVALLTQLYSPFLIEDL